MTEPATESASETVEEGKVTSGLPSDVALQTLHGTSVENATGHDPGYSRKSLELLQGVEMTVTVELGKTRILMKDLLGLRAGAVIELDRPVGSLVDVVLNGVVLARGELVVVDDDELGVRIAEIVSNEGGA